MGADTSRLSFDDVLTALQHAGDAPQLLRYTADRLNEPIALGPLSRSWISGHLRDYADLLDRQSERRPSRVRRQWDNRIGDYRDIEE